LYVLQEGVSIATEQGYQTPQQAQKPGAESHSAGSSYQQPPHQQQQQPAYTSGGPTRFNALVSLLRHMLSAHAAGCTCYKQLFTPSWEMLQGKASNA
jgi:hypothetical protein